MSEEMIQYLVLDRRDPSRNMARFYVLAIEPNLFGSTTLFASGDASAGEVSDGSRSMTIGRKPWKRWMRGFDVNGKEVIRCESEKAGKSSPPMLRQTVSREP
jgi:hypothetical protein